MKFKSLFSLALGAALLTSATASAHFQLIYAPSAILEKPGSVDVKLVFWHPMENGHAMDMGEPEEFFMIHKGKKTDLKDSLKPIMFKEAKAYDGAFSAKRNGDYVLATVPAPYYEESEDIYIQQITTAYFNKGDTPSDWSQPLGLKTEILPLQKPYGVLVGSTFTGVVLKEGKPAPGVEIEIEYMVARPDMVKNVPTTDKGAALPGGAIAIVSDEKGQFTFGIPKAGYWGFAALGSGPDTEYNGKELSQDSVIWIEAHSLD